MADDIPKLLGVDLDLNLFELTDLFYAYYKYHNEDYLTDYNQFVSLDSAQNRIQVETSSLSRYQALRRIEGVRLGSRPFLAGKGIAKHRPNISMGYLRWFFDYLVLPYQSIFTDSDLVKVRINKKLYDIEKLTDTELEELRVQAANNPNLVNNAEIGDDVSDAYADVLKTSEKFRTVTDRIPIRIIQDGIVALLHSDMDWAPEVIPALDLVTEPQAEFNPSNWSSFFIIRKMTAQEAVRHIRSETTFWRPEALRWALENSYQGGNLLNSSHHQYGYNDRDNKNPTCGENFMVKSFMEEKSSRLTNVSSYYGNMFVVECYYVNKKGKVDKVIFFPSNDFYGVSSDLRQQIESFVGGGVPDSDEEFKRFEGADVLFHRENVFKTMKEAISIIPFDRGEPSLERQRAYGHELFAPIEMIMRLDTSILNFAILMGVPFYKNRAQGTDAQDLQDLELEVNGEMVDLGDRDFVTLPFQADLQGMIAVRQMLLQHAAQKAFLGGLDGAELTSSGRGANLAELRLVRDGRVIKHDVEALAKGLHGPLTKILRRILDLRDRDLTDPLIQKRFFDVLTKVHGIDEEIFDFDEKDVIEDTDLPYWMALEIIRNGGSHFGPAELVLYSQIKQLFGDGLTQQQGAALNRMAIKSLLGSQDAIDILGDPKDTLVFEQDQVYQATLESASITGSVDDGALNFKVVPVRIDKDDHVLHLTQVHNPDATQIIQTLQEGNVTPDQLADLSEDQLDTRTDLILKLAAHAAHISQHQNALELFGRKRDDINQLREETNVILQSAEALLNNLQLNIRAAQQKRQERELRLQNLSPENEAEKAKAESEMMELQAKRQGEQEKLALANKIADDNQRRHIDKQVSKARDRNLKREMASTDAQLRAMEIQTKASVDLAKIDTSSGEGR